MKEKILEAFANLGFKLEDADGAGYVFNYEGIRYIYMHNDDDEEFFTIALPGFYDYDEEHIGQYCALAEKINSTLKYIKAYTLCGRMWLFYERELLGEDDLDEIIPRMIIRLEAGLQFAHNALEEIDASFDQDDEDQDDEDSGESGCEDVTDDNE